MRHMLTTIRPWLLTLAVVAAVPAAFAGTGEERADATGAPVAFAGQPLFVIQAPLGSFSARERAEVVLDRLKVVVADPSFQAGMLRLVERPEGTRVAYDDFVILTVTDDDATVAGRPRSALAQERLTQIRDAVVSYRDQRSARRIVTGVLLSLLATLLLALYYRLAGKAFARMERIIAAGRKRWIRPIAVRDLEILPAAQVADLLVGASRVTRFILSLAALYIYVSLVAGLFPWTRGLAAVLAGYILSPLKAVWHALVTYLPNLLFIIVVALIAHYVLRLIGLVAAELEKGTISFPGFYQEWASPTYKLVRLVVIALAIAAAFPYIPGSSSPAFQGISVFLGVLFSLGSTSAVANMVAGTVITYMRPFQVGDRVRIADTTGDVIEKTLLVTRVRTIKNEDITIPNALVLGTHIANYSSSAREQGLILHASVTIGYDVPWRQVHGLLLAAASRTSGTLADPPPFVLQTGLDDFYVSYQVNVRTDQPGKMALIYSELYQSIQDCFNEAGVEILSPHYSALRDGNQVTVPAGHLPDTYEPPAFRVAVRRGALPTNGGEDRPCRPEK